MYGTIDMPSERKMPNKNRHTLNPDEGDFDDEDYARQLRDLYSYLESDDSSEWSMPYDRLCHFLLELPRA